MLGMTVDIDGSGNTIAVSSPFINGSGQARVYGFANGDWVQKGGVFEPAASVLSMRYATSISLSQDGDCIAIGSMNYMLPEPGMVEVFRFNGTAWEPKGVPAHGGAPYDGFGQSVSISNDGNTFVVSAPFIDNAPQPAPESTYARVYRYQNGFWLPMGQKLYPWPFSAGHDVNVRISGNGAVVAVNYMQYGVVILYDYAASLNSWNLTGDPVNVGTCASFGQSISLNDEGSVLAASGYPSPGQGAFHVYEQAFLDLQLPEDESFVLFPNPAADRLNVEGLDEETHLTLIDLTGKVVLDRQLDSADHTVDLSAIAMGNYTVKLINKNHTILRKLVVN
jgi:hypothetical protein